MSMSGPRQIRLRYLRDAQILSFVSCIVLSHSLISAEMEYHGIFPPELVWGGGFGHYGLCVAEWEVRLPPPSAGDLSLPIGHNARVWVETQ